jgi:hypothetical protein
MAKKSDIEMGPGERPGPGYVLVEALVDDVILDATRPRVKKGGRAWLGRHDAEHWQRGGLLRIVEG